MATIKDNSLRNFLDSEFANSESNSGSRNNLESGNTIERRDGAEIVEGNNNADVNLNRSKTTQTNTKTKKTQKTDQELFKRSL